MNVTHLRAFHEVASAGSFTLAAQRMHVSQPTLSEQVKALEHTYGATLFSRRGRSIALTPVGEELLAITGRMAELDQEAELCLASARDLTGGRLRLGADAPIHAMPLLAAFARRHPDVELSLSTGNAEQVRADVLEHRVDAAVLSGPVDDPRLAALTLIEDDFIAIVHRDDRLARRKRVRLEELVAHRVILREAGSQTRRTLDAALAEAGLATGEVIEVDSRDAAQTAVAMRLGVAVGAASELSRDARLVAIPIGGARLRLTESLVCLTSRRGSRLLSAVFAAASARRRGALRSTP